MIRANNQQIPQHLHGSRDDVQFASCDFVPFYGYFRHRDSELFGKEKELYVEYPCGKMLCGEYLLSG